MKPASETACRNCGEEMGEAFSDPDNSLCGIFCVVEANGYCDDLPTDEVVAQFVDELIAKARGEIQEGDDPAPVFARGAASLLRWLISKGDRPLLDTALADFLAAAREAA